MKIIVQGTIQDILKETGVKKFEQLFNNEIDFNGMKMTLQSCEAMTKNICDMDCFTLLFETI